jgi:hypothetical protein
MSLEKLRELKNVPFTVDDTKEKREIERGEKGHLRMYTTLYYNECVV